MEGVFFYDDVIMGVLEIIVRAVYPFANLRSTN
jgi:hypothetical protein